MTLIGLRTRTTPCCAYLLLLGLVFAVSSGLAEISDAERRLELLPQPKEMQVHEGGFRVRAATRIVVELGHQAEDRIAAETLAEEIADQSGMQVTIVGAKQGATTPDSTIVLARLQDPRVQRYLATKGLKADAAIGEQGYLLFSDKSHVIVAANSGEGVFYGVQTLRQLLRPEGKDLICPAVAIRDWPGLQWPGVHDTSLLEDPHGAHAETRAAAPPQ
jgi:hexosaminidase